MFRPVGEGLPLTHTHTPTHTHRQTHTLLTPCSHQMWENEGEAGMRQIECEKVRGPGRVRVGFPVCEKGRVDIMGEEGETRAALMC